MLPVEIQLGHRVAFDGIDELPPGTLLRATREGTERTSWYDLRKAAEPQEDLPEQAAIGALGDLVTRAVKLLVPAVVGVPEIWPPVEPPPPLDDPAAIPFHVLIVAASVNL